MTPAETEQHRLQCEARAWLKAGYTSKTKVKQLTAKIAKKRGYQAAVTLKDEMRRQYKQIAGDL